MPSDNGGVPGEFRPQSAVANDETAMFDHLRTSEYGRLDAHDHVYLDYTGAGLYGESQVASHTALLQRAVFGNPHSGSLTSVATTTLVERTRRHVLEFFHAGDRY